MKTYTAVIKGRDTDEDTLRDVLGDEFELVSLQAGETTVSREDQLIQTRKDIWSYLSDHTELSDVETALGKSLDRALCNEVLKEIKDSLECLSDDTPMASVKEKEFAKPTVSCAMCKKPNPKMDHDGNKFCDLVCVHKYIHQ